MKKLTLALFTVVVLVLPLAACRRHAPKVTGGSPKLTICFAADEQPSEKTLVSQVIQAQLKAHGIEVTLEPLQSGPLVDRVGKGEFQAMLGIWYLDYNDAEGFLTDFYSKASLRISKYSSAEFDAAYERGLFASTADEKRREFRKAVEVLRADLPWVPLFSNDELFLLRRGAGGFRANSHQYYDYRRVKLPAVRAASDIEVQTLDPALAYDLASKHLVTQSYEGLVAMDNRNEIVPALAMEWAWEDSGTSLVFNLREGVRFHTTPFLSTPELRALDSSDVKASFERLIKLNSPYTYIFDHVVGVDEFKAGKAADVSGFVAEAPLKFRIKLKRAFPTMLPWLLAPAANVLPKELPKDYDFAKGSAGTGPFILRSWDGGTAQFAANTDYWLSENGQRLPLAKMLTVRVVQDANAARLAFQQGELDVWSIPLALYDAVLDAAGQPKTQWKEYEFRAIRLNNLKFIAFNMAAGPWGKEVALRRSVDEAVDRGSIVRQLFRGHARPATSMVPEGVAGFGTEDAPK
jgi:ABC-type transport system substrate-binding protein